MNWIVRTSNLNLLKVNSHQKGMIMIDSIFMFIIIWIWMEWLRKNIEDERP